MYPVVMEPRIYLRGSPTGCAKSQHCGTVIDRGRYRCFARIRFDLLSDRMKNVVLCRRCAVSLKRGGRGERAFMIGGKLFEGERKSRVKFLPDSRGDYLHETRSPLGEFEGFILVSECE
jgi:hypothetical protein